MTDHNEEEFCDGVKLILKRIESNPDEFMLSEAISSSYHKWAWLYELLEDHYRIPHLNSVIPYPSDYEARIYKPLHVLDSVEVDAIISKLRPLHRKSIENKVLRTLLPADQPEQSEFAFGDSTTISTYPNIVSTAGVSAGGWRTITNASAAAPIKPIYKKIP